MPPKKSPTKKLQPASTSKSGQSTSEPSSKSSSSLQTMIGEQREKFNEESSQPSVEENENLTKLAEAKLQNVKDGNVGEHEFEKDLRQQQLYKELPSL